MSQKPFELNFADFPELMEKFGKDFKGRVKIVDLHAHQELNGKLCTIIGIDDKSGRYKVEIDDEPDPKR